MVRICVSLDGYVVWEGTYSLSFVKDGHEAARDVTLAPYLYSSIRVNTRKDWCTCPAVYFWG